MTAIEALIALTGPRENPTNVWAIATIVLVVTGTLLGLVGYTHSPWRRMGRTAYGAIVALPFLLSIGTTVRAAYDFDASTQRERAEMVDLCERTLVGIAEGEIILLRIPEADKVSSTCGRDTFVRVSNTPATRLNIVP